MKWIESLLSRKPIPGISCRMISMDPALATELLLLNTHNRKISPATVKKYVKEITGDEWYPSPAGVGIDVNNVLVDGQTRLQAIIESKQTVPMLVVWGLPPESQEKVDRQRRRTLFDAFYLANIEQNRKAVQVATFFARQRVISSEGLFSRTPADCEVKIELMRHRPAFNALLQIGAIGSLKGIHAVGVTAALLRMYEISPKMATEFWMGLKEPVVCKTPNDPRYRLRKYLVSDYRPGRGAGGSAQFLDYQKAVYAMNAWIHGKEIASVRDLADFDLSDVCLSVESTAAVKA